MEQKTYRKLYEDGAFHLLYIDLLNKSGYAGCNPNGNIVDRRFYPDAVPIQENSIFGVVKPKETTALDLIAKERQHQIEIGRTIEKDVEINTKCQLSEAASLLCVTSQHIRDNDDITDFEIVPFKWNEELFNQMMRKPYKERLIIAGALIAAELDRLQSLENDYFKCESCGKVITDEECPARDSDDNHFCAPCWKELEPVMRAEYEELKRKGEID